MLVGVDDGGSVEVEVGIGVGGGSGVWVGVELGVGVGIAEGTGDVPAVGDGLVAGVGEGCNVTVALWVVGNVATEVDDGVGVGRAKAVGGASLVGVGLRSAEADGEGGGEDVAMDAVVGAAVASSTRLGTITVKIERPRGEMNRTPVSSSVVEKTSDTKRSACPSSFTCTATRLFSDFWFILGRVM